MQIRLAQGLGKRLPPALAQPVLPWLAKIDAILAGEGDSAVSQRTALVAFTIRVASAAIAYLSQVMMARWMGEFEYGIYVTVWVAILLLGNISCLGFQTGVIRFISDYLTTGRDSYLRGSIALSLAGTFLLSTMLALTGAAIVHAFANSITSYFVIPILLAAVCLPMITLQEVQDGVARAFNWPGTALGPTYILRPLLILLVMALAIYFGYDADARTAMLAAIVATWFASLFQFAALLYRLRGRVPRGPRAYAPRNWLLIAMPIFLVEGFYNLLTNADILFVSYYMSPEDVAIYFAAVKTLALVHFVYFAVKAGAAHRFAAYKASGDRARFEQFVQETTLWTFWPSLLLACVMVLVGRYFLLLFGPGFVEGHVLIFILAIGVIIRSSVGAAESVLTMSGEQKICAALYASTLAVNLVLNFTLIPLYGLKGAAIATTLALTYEAMALYATAKRRLGLHIFIIPARMQANQGGNSA